MKEIELAKVTVEEKLAALEVMKQSLIVPPNTSDSDNNNNSDSDSDSKPSSMAPWTCSLMSAVEAGLTCIMTTPKVDCVGYPLGMIERINICIYIYIYQVFLSLSLLSLSSSLLSLSLSLL